MTASSRWEARFAAAGIAPMRVYDEIMVPRMFEPWGNVLLDELALAPGEAVLDIATGPGTIARLAAARVGPSGRVVGCDLSPAMLAIARGKPPIPGAAPISYIECSADALDVPSDSVDAVTCQQGLQFFPDRPAALAEMRRAARGGARLGIAVWGPIEQSPPYDAVAQGIAAVLGEDAAATYRGGPYGFTDPDALSALIESAGFSHVTLTRHERPQVFEGGPSQIVDTIAVSALGPRLAELDDAVRQELVDAVARAAAPFIEDGEIRSFSTSHIVCAVA
jgi:ubiquinone/menaquinone biosynthesis C-methylase UbiE